MSKIFTKNVELTNLIINMIEKENVIDFKEQVLLRQEKNDDKPNK